LNEFKLPVKHESIMQSFEHFSRQNLFGLKGSLNLSQEPGLEFYIEHNQTFFLEYTCCLSVQPLFSQKTCY